VGKTQGKGYREEMRKGREGYVLAEAPQKRNCLCP